MNDLYTKGGVLTEEQVEDVCGDDVDDVVKTGILKGRNMMYDWIHFTFQEYLAAEYACTTQSKYDCYCICLY